MAKASLPRNNYNRTHGEGFGKNRTPEYSSYRGAKDRCTCTTNQRYADYGGRGIEFRFESYEHFLAVLGRKPTLQHSLDRIDNDGHYEPGNVRWATKKEQSANQRSTRLITFKGETLCATEWARRLNIKEGTIQNRKRLGWCDECTITQPVDDRRRKVCTHYLAHYPKSSED